MNEAREMAAHNDGSEAPPADPLRDAIEAFARACFEFALVLWRK